MGKLSSIYNAIMSLSKDQEGHFYIEIYYNDFFGWALSYVEVFKSKKNQSLKSFVKEIKNLTQKYDIQSITKEYESVPYPSYPFKSKELDNYFMSNWNIHQKVCEVIRDKFQDYIFKENWGLTE